MLKNLIFNDIFKQKRTMLTLMVILIPLVTTMLLGIDFFIRYKSYLYDVAVGKGMTSWEILLNEEKMVFFNQYLPLFVAVIIGSIFDTEYKNNGWTLTLTEPIKRENIILSKILASIAFVLIMLILNAVGLIAIGFIMKFPEAFSLTLILKSFLLKFLGALSIITIHLFLTLKYRNTLVSIGISAVLCFVSENLLVSGNVFSNYNPYSFAFSSCVMKNINLLQVSLISIALFIVGLIINFKFFNMKESY